MNASATLVSVHLAGEGKDEIVLDTLPGKFTVTRTDEALTPSGGLAKGLDRESLRQWTNRPQTELSAALPERFIADWDSTVNTRYGHQEDAAVGYNPHKRGRKSHHPLILRGCAHPAVPALGMAAGRHGQFHRLAAGDGKTLESPGDPRTAPAQSR